MFLSRKCTKAFGVLCTPRGFVKVYMLDSSKNTTTPFPDRMHVRVLQDISKTGETEVAYTSRTLSLPANGEQFTTVDEEVDGITNYAA